MLGKRIKVLFISSWYPNRFTPTLGNFVQKHAEAVSLYADVSVLHVCFDTRTGGNRFEITREAEGNINSIRIYVRKPRTVLKKIFLYLRAYRKGFDMVTKEYGSPDIVHANVIFPVGLISLFLKPFKRIPFVLSEHWTGYLQEDPAKRGCITKYFSKRIVRKASVLMPVSDDLKNAMVKMGFAGTYHVIPDVVDKEFYQPFPSKIKNDKVRFLHVSSLNDRQKNVSGIIRVIHQLSLIRKDFELLIVTDGEAEPFIKMAKEYGIFDKTVFFESTKSVSELAAIYKQSDCLLLFSNFESFSVVVAESLASGVPVIATNAGGIAGNLGKEHGIIIAPGDEKALLNSITYMIEHHEEYNKKKMTDFAEQFSYEKVGEQFLNIYKQTIQSFAE